MILSRIEIENYKQYSGQHEIVLPSLATIGVIGANGVGKTTLFEAIEWCLYNPSTIANKDIRPRGRVGYTKVSVALEAPDGSQRFVVERELKRTNAHATIYEIEESGEGRIIVQGTRPVTNYVATRLIGLSHKAFVATFFTRQKELHFFGDLGDTDRRREVGRLLGLETIRLAQQDIADDRKRAQADAQALKRQYEDQSSDRDFAAELAGAQEAIKEREADVARASAAVTSAETAMKTAEATLTHLQELKDQDSALAQQVTALRGELGTTEQQLTHIDARVARIETLEQQRRELEPLAARLPRLRQQMTEMDEQRTRFLRRREIQQAIREAERRRGDHISSLRSTVVSIELHEPLDGWHWHEQDSTDPMVAIERLQTSIETIDLDAAIRYARTLQHCRDTAKALRDEEHKLQHYTSVRAKFEQLAAQICADGEPADTLREISTRRDETQQRVSMLTAQRASLEQRRDQSTRLISSLQQARFDDRCPTCARPFSNEDADVVLESLRMQVERDRKDIESAKVEAAQAKRLIEQLDARRTTLQAKADELAKLRGRIENSVSVLSEQHQMADRARKALERVLAEASLAVAPEEHDIERASVRVEFFRKITSTRTHIIASRERLIGVQQEVARHREELATIGEVTFDEQAWRDLSEEHQHASNARTTVEHISHDIAERPALIAQRAECVERQHGQQRNLAALERQRSELGFDPDALAAASDAVTTARRAEREAIEHRHSVQALLRDAQQAVETIQADEARLKQLAERSDQRQREHDELDQMYREFTEFERYAAGRLTPILGDMTSELVREVTDGKYDHVTYDSNFGIEVFDGDEEHFPLSSFSGGERDAISLCARLALSRVIGSQAASPPGFLVLDEVFGSLDRDRRTRLLDLLGTITGSADSFRQVFIISHVDDVRSAPVFDELWRIEETAEGESQLNAISAGADLDEL